MKPLTFAIKDLRLVKDLNIEFPNSGVVLIKGKNNIGKSTAITAFKDLISANNTSTLSDGVSNGSTVGTFKLPSGEELIVRMDMSEGRLGSRFVLIDDQGKKKTKIGDIQDLFKYNPFTIEEFISWGSYAEGRRKQRNIFLDVLGENVKKEFLALESLEKKTYDQRTEANNQELMLSSHVEKSKPSTTDYDNVMKIDDLIKKCSTLEGEYLNANSVLEVKKEQIKPFNEINKKYVLKKKEVDDKLSQYVEKELFYKKEEEEIYRRLNELQNNKIKELSIIKEEGEKLRSELNSLGKQLSEIQNVDITEFEKLELVSKSNLLDCKKQLESLRESQIAVTNYNLNLKMLSDAKVKAHELNDKVMLIRNNKDTLVLNSECPIKDIRIVDDGLEINIGGRWLPLDINHVSQSQLIFAVSRINIESNKNLPVTLISRGESLDSDMLKEIVKFAKETDSIFLVERVEDNIGNIQCEIIIE